MREAPDSQTPARPIRVGVVARGLAQDPNTRGVVAGIVEIVRGQGGSVICFELDGVVGEIEDFVGTGNVDAYVILAGSLLRTFGKGVLEAFCAKRRALPIVAVAGVLEGVSTVRVDRAGGIRKAVGHLVDVHGRRRIAFLCEATTGAGTGERLSGYRAALAERGIPFDKELVIDAPDFEAAGEAVRTLLDQRRADPEAIVVFNDTVAFATIAALIERGIEVPQQIAVVGSANIGESGDFIPPLTTVRQKLEEQGRRAATFVLGGLQGKEIPRELVLDTELVVRRSCGCVPEAILHDGEGPDDVTPIGGRGGDRDVVEHAMTRILGVSDRTIAQRLLAAFSHDLDLPASSEFSTLLDEELMRVARSQAVLEPWQSALLAMRRMLLPELASDPARHERAEEIWQKAQNAMVEMARRAQAFHRILDGRRAHSLSGISRSLITTNDIQELTTVLSQSLPKLGVTSCYVSLFDGRDSRDWSTLVVGIDAGGALSMHFGDRFRTSDLLPEGTFENDRGYTVVVMPLAFKNEQLGTILLEVDPSQSTEYDELRGQFGAAFERMERERELVFLHEAQRERADELEKAHAQLRENQEKLLLAESMASLGRLTAGMAHEMNTPLAAVRAALGELLQLIEEYRVSIDSSEITPHDHREIAKEMVVSAKLADSAAQRVAGFVRSIKAETRDLASQDHRRFNAVHVVRDALLLLNHAARNANCVIDLDAERETMELFGSPGRFVQIVTNLVTNAIDACVDKGGGAIAVRLIGPDGALELQVVDEGTGIAPENMGKIFEPMYTTKPFGVGTGLGLPIVRDLATGHFNGSVEVRTEVGVGTTFVVLLGDHALTSAAT